MQRSADRARDVVAARRVRGTRSNEIIRCPWHGWEFDLRTGQSWFDPRAVRVRRYDVSVEPGALVVAS